MNKQYLELLKDPRWQKKRLKIMERDNFMCQFCYDEKTTLNVHHKRYVKGKAPWEYEDKDLITLCEDCHEQTGVYKRDRNINLFSNPILYIQSRNKVCVLLFVNCNQNLLVIKIYKEPKKWEELFFIGYDISNDLITLLGNEKNSSKG